MGFSTGFGISQKQEPGGLPVGPPFAADSAENGLSVDSLTGRIVLGQSPGDATNPATLLNDREIPLSGFGLSFIGADYLGTPHRIRISDDLIEMIGENDNANGTHITMTDLNSGLVTDISNTGTTLQITSGSNVNISGSSVNAEIILTAHDIVNGIGPLVSVSPEIGFDVQGTFNAPAVVKTLMGLSLNDNASAAGSLLMDLQVNSNSVFSVRKDGRLAITDPVTNDAAELLAGSFDMQSGATGDVIQFDTGSIGLLDGAGQFSNISLFNSLNLWDNPSGNRLQLLNDGAGHGFLQEVQNSFVFLDLDLATGLTRIAGDLWNGTIGQLVMQTNNGDLSVVLGDVQAAVNSTLLRVDDNGQSIDLQTAQVTINGTPGFSGTVTPVTSITVVNGIVTAVS